METPQPVGSVLVCRGLGAPAIDRIEATVQCSPSGVARFRFVLRAELSGLRIPQTRPARRADDLWRHTCFEAFIRPAEKLCYHEFNFSPSLEWALYRFNSYRQGMVAVDIGTAPQIVVRRLAGTLELEATVRLRDLIGMDQAKRLHVGLSAVVESDDGTLSYWALTHPAEQADFHRAEGFLLELEM